MYKILDQKEHAVTIGQAEVDKATQQLQSAAAAADSTLVRLRRHKPSATWIQQEGLIWVSVWCLEAYRSLWEAPLGLQENEKQFLFTIFFYKFNWIIIVKIMTQIIDFIIVTKSISHEMGIVFI